MRVLIASDHAGFKLKERLKAFLSEKHPSVKLVDLGTHSEEPVDFPDFAHALAKKLGEKDFGILVCGSGQGMAVTANKHKRVRAALCWSVETARQAREHLNANVLCLGGRVKLFDEPVEILSAFLETGFNDKEVKYARRVKKIAISAREVK